MKLGSFPVFTLVASFFVLDDGEEKTETQCFPLRCLVLLQLSEIKVYPSPLEVIQQISPFKDRNRERMELPQQEQKVQAF